MLNAHHLHAAGQTAEGRLGVSESAPLLHLMKCFKPLKRGGKLPVKCVSETRLNDDYVAMTF